MNEDVTASDAMLDIKPLPSELAESTPISEADFKGIVRLLGKVAGMTDPLAVRKRALMDGLCAMIGVKRWLWTTSTNFHPGEVPVAIAVAYGGFSDRECATLLEASQDPEYPIPENEAMISDINNHGHITRTRSDWISDEELYNHPQWKLYRQHAGTDHYLFSLYPVVNGFISGVGFHRPPGEPDFTPRERRIVHIVASEIDWLHTADVPEAESVENAHKLTPRLRVVFMLLIKGWNRKKIAAHLGITPNTTAGYIKTIYRQFGVSSQSELISAFVQGDGGDSMEP